jgi:hypothetical protein
MATVTSDRIKERKKKWLSDIVLFSKQVLPNYIQYKNYGVPKFHEEIYREMLLDSSGWFRTERQVSLRCPRGFAKTTLGIVYCLWNILFRRKNYIIIISQSNTMAKEKLEKIKHELESNKVIKKYFGPQDVKLTKDEYGKWRQDEIVTSAGGIRVISVGLKQGIRGTGHWQYRPDLVIGDDIEGERDVTTPEIRRKAKDLWFRAVAQAVDDQHGQMIYLFTPSHEDCLGLMLERLTTWRSLKWGAFTTIGSEDGPLLWPEKHPRELLMKKKQEFEEIYDFEGWAMEYLCTVTPKETAVFRREWIKNYAGEYEYDGKHHKLILSECEDHPDWVGDKRERILNVSVGVDLATGRSRRTGSKTAFMVVGTDQDNHTWLLETSVGHYDPGQIMDSFFEIDKKYNGPEFSVEQNSFQYLIYGPGGWFEERQKKEGRRLRVARIKEETGKKEDRIESYYDRIKSETFHVKPPEHSRDLIRPMIDYRRDKSKELDALDALHKAFAISRRAPTPSKTPEIDEYYADRVRYWGNSTHSFDDILTR